MKRNTRQNKQRFLDAIERGMSVKAAARHALVDRTTPYVWERKDPVFRQDWENIKLLRLQRLVDTAYDLALEGDVQLIKWLITRYEQQTQRPEVRRTTIRIIEPVEADRVGGASASSRRPDASRAASTQSGRLPEEGEQPHDFITFGA